MRHLVNKVLLKYLIILLLTFFMGLCLTVISHFILLHLEEKITKKVTSLETKLSISHTITQQLHNVHLKFLELSAATKNPQEREHIILEIKNTVRMIQQNSDTINHGGVFQVPSSQKWLQYTKIKSDQRVSEQFPELTINLSLIDAALDTILPLIEQRDTTLSNHKPLNFELIKNIRVFNAQLETVFEKLLQGVNHLIEQDQKYFNVLNQESASQEKIYQAIDIAIILLTAFSVLFITYTISNHIIGLYKEMENQLYIDTPTKLKNRFALIKDLSEAQNPSVSIIDINSFRTINELYGTSVGNEVLILFANLIKQFSKHRDFMVYRISGDEFVFFKDSVDLRKQDVITLLEDFFEMVENKKIYVASINDCVYLDLSVGISFEKENTLGTADIALHKAKELHTQFVFYHSGLDAIKELQQGAFWKKRIIEGIEKNLFLPFFQPIVNKEQKIVKYEALMRLKQDENGIFSFVSPHEFLEIASKTRHYDQISKMTLLKSIEKCAQTNIPISLNLSYNDILNQSLHEELKKAILKYDIGKKLIFEIVESQNIKNYSLLKKFMADFEHYGVRFAVDDFGTGFSNFSHIFELSPDFIKIDGSLIKNIHTDKKSYELVKAIVFFSKQLDIKTIAEFIHSKEVFEIAYLLGIDQFQGYYFGEPQEDI